MRKLYSICQLLASLMLGFIGVAAYDSNAVAGAIFIAASAWLAFKDNWEPE
jgi:hypothetical protein